jgi:protein-S-isoprenylcysteine O-methyltransferase Ste14/ribosomal protein S18 acetylase RimI-like enzyme
MARVARLRPATPADVPRLTELVRAAYGHYVERLGGPPRPLIDDYDEVVRGRRVTVAERGGEVAGLIVLDEDEEGFLVDNVAVDPAHQGTGVGRALLEHAEDAARAAGFDSIYLYTHELMTENLALYGRIGYVEYARRRHGDASLVYLRKPLTAGPGRRLRAAIGSAVFLVVAPGVAAGLVPWLLTGWDSTDPPVWIAVTGGVLTAAGAAMLLHSFARFVVEGIGTPAPIAPTERLVVGGLYRHVRNPMYVAVTAAIAGQALLLGRPWLLAYAAGFWLVTAAFVRFYEEPTLSARYGEEYAAYRRAVPAWLPRLRPWEGGTTRGPAR